MTDETIPQTVLFPDLFDRPLVATFDQAHASSDGGAILLKAADARLGLIAALTGCLTEDRVSTRVAHTLQDLVAQRVFAIACGYPDANDANRLADDPIHKLLLDRDPRDGLGLASQPTLSRFENGVSRTELYEMGHALALRVVERHQRRLHGRARRITIDLDPTDDPTPGAQQLSFFNGHYDTWCYLPLLAFVTFNDEREQYLCAAVLRPGNAPATRGALGVLRRLVPLLRTAFPKTRIRVRCDGGFACPELFAYLEASIEAIHARDASVLTRIVERCCRLKADVVEQDEREETGLRSILNYGHTFCHAFEAATGYELLLHGEGVAIGMMCAARLAERLGRVDAAFVERQRALLESFGLPLEVPDVDRDELIELMYRDKKVERGRLRFVLPTRLGHVELVRDVAADDIHAALAAEA